MSIKVLCICREASHNVKRHNYSVAEFIYEQNQHLAKLDVVIDYYLVRRGGLLGYLNEIKNIRHYLNSVGYNYDIIHAHGGHIGAIANFERRIPVITTYHGSDINYYRNRLISILSLLLSKQNIFVSKNLFNKVRWSSKTNIIPCGVDFELFIPLKKEECRQELGLDYEEKIALFAGNRDIKVKNFELAESAVKLTGKNIRLIELKDFSRNHVKLLLNAVDLLLLTSISEGSPQIIKEAMACNCPIVATDVGDIKETISGIDGCYISCFNKEEIVHNINLALQFNLRTAGRDGIKNLDNRYIAKQVFETYTKVLNTK